MFKSQAQRAKFAILLKQGKISKAVFDEWNKATGNRKLPKHVKKRKNANRRR